MAVQNILPSAPLSGDDIRDTINNFGGVADNNWLTYFQSNDVNKWSKFKPVKYAANHTTGNEDPPFWKAHDGLCGFTSGSIIFGSVDAMIAAVKSGTTFVYDPPIGGSTYPYRGGDWRNYNSSAKAPFWDVYAYGSFINGNSSSKVDFELLDNSNGIDKNTNLVLGDILPAGTNVANWYFGVVIVSGSTQFKKSATTSIGSGASIPEAARKFSVTLGESGVSGSYTVYPCLYQRIPQSNTSYGSVMPIPLQMSGGSTGSGISGSVVQQSPTIGWSGNTFAYRSGFMSFRGTLAYASSSEGTRVNVTINEIKNGVVRYTYSTGYFAVSKTSSSGTQNFMEFEYDSRWPTDGDSYEMIVSSNIQVKSIPQIVNGAPPLS